MRTEGSLRNWNDDRGFGFIVTAETKQDVFVHISSFPHTGRRPQPGERLAFSIETGHDGKRRAVSVNYLDPPTAASVAAAPHSAPRPPSAPARTHEARRRHVQGRRRERKAAPRRVGGLLTLLAVAGIGTAIVKRDAIEDLLPSSSQASTAIAPSGIATTPSSSMPSSTMPSSGAPENASPSDAISDRLPPSPPSSSPASSPDPALSQISSPSSAYRCDGRTHCSQMTSCAEAEYFLRNCPGVQMDGNNDGEPCEQQWCH